MTCYHRTITTVLSETRFNLLSLMVVSPLYHFCGSVGTGLEEFEGGERKGERKG